MLRRRLRDTFKGAGRPDPLGDIADDVRYAIYTFITSAEKPRELLIREVTQPLAAQGDLTSANIRYLQKMEELEGVSQPIWLGRRRMLPRRPYRR